MTIVVTKDIKLATEIRKTLNENDGFCPCKLIKNETTKCMCEDFMKMEEGTCHCGLYTKIK